jgi:hypothetical protein
MDVRINQVSSSVNVTDSQSMLSPQVMNQLLRVLREQIREELEREQRIEAERRLRQGVSSRDEDS